MMSKVFTYSKLILTYRKLVQILIICLLSITVISGCDTPQGKILTTELAAVSPESAITLAVNEWAPANRFPYQNLRIRYFQDDSSYKLANISVELRETNEDRWTYAWTVAEIKNVGLQWLAPSELVFRALYDGTPYHRVSWRLLGNQPGNSTADSAAVTAFRDWAGKETTPYKNIAIQDLREVFADSEILSLPGSSPSFVTVRMWVSFQASVESGWEEKWADVLCSKVDSQWHVISDFHFASGTAPTSPSSPTRLPTTGPTQRPASTATHIP